MDSNKIQNEQTNTFSGGMNTDAADHVLGNDQYRDALNLRFVNNKDGNSGSLKVINGFDNLYTGFHHDDKLNADIKEHVIETTQVGEYGIFFTEDEQYKIRVYRFPIDKENVISKDVTLIFGPCADWDIYGSNEKKQNGERSRLSIIGRKEGEDNIKLYIADGIHQIIIMDVLNEQQSTTIKNLLTNSYEQLLPPTITNIINGSLKAGKVQYAFQLYSKYKKQTALSPLSKQINVVNFEDSGYSFKGAAKDKNTNMGIEVKIQIPDVDNYDLIKIYRLHYQQNAELPEIDVIYDGAFINKTSIDKNDKSFYYKDVSNNSISKISVEDFNSKSGIYMIPKIIESKDDYLFAAQIKEYRQSSKKFDNINTVSLSFSKDEYTYIMNVNDNDLQSYALEYLSKNNWKNFYELTSIKDCWNPLSRAESGYVVQAGPEDCYFTKKYNGVSYYGGSGKHVDWRFITTIIPADYGSTKGLSYGSSNWYIDKNGNKSTDVNINKYYIRYDGTLEYAGKLMDTPEKNQTYANPIISNSLVSLRRGETYRFGIIFTDKDGVSSPVKWITDVTVPDINVKGFYSFMNKLEDRELSVLPLGIEFNIHDINNNDIYSYEIVRCNRGADDAKVIAQGVLSRPVIKRFKDNDVNKTQQYTPSGFLTINRLNILHYFKHDEASILSRDYEYRVDNFTNDSLFQFISPEISYFKTSTFNIIANNNTSLNMLKYLFSKNSNEQTITQHIDYDAAQKVHDVNNNLPLNQTNFICNTGVEYLGKNVSPLINKLIPKENNKSYNTYLFNNLDVFNTAYNIFSASNILTQNVYGGTIDQITINDKQTSGGDQEMYNAVFGEMNIKTQYFKLYCQSDEVLVGDCDKDNPYNNWSGVDREHGVGFQIIKHDVYNKYGITSSQITDSLKWNDLFEIKNDKAAQKFSDKVNIVGTYGFCNVVCYDLFDKEPVATLLNKRPTLIQFRPYALGGTSMLVTIDKKLYKKIDVNNRLLTEVIGTDNVSNFTKDINGNYAFGRSWMTEFKEKLSKNKYIDENDVEHEFIRASMFGTVLCNITREVSPYGGFSKSAKDSSIYYSYSNIKEFKNNQDNIIQVFNGDTYIGPFEYTSAHKVSNKAVGMVCTINAQYAIPVESSINMYIDHGYNFSRNINEKMVSWIQENPGNVDNVFTQDIPQYEYNSAYSITESVDQKFSTLSYDTKNKQTYNFRCRYSNKKENGELEDSWQNFKAANYLDVDPNYGKITGLKRFRNNLIFFQERAFGAFSVNERTAVSDNNSHEILLGSGGVLSRYDYISTTSGLEDNVFAYATTATSLYWIDVFNTSFCQYSGGDDYKQISITKGINTAVSYDYQPAVDKIKDYKVLTDPKYNEVYFTSKDGVFTFSEIQQVFTSRYSYDGYCDSIVGKYKTFIANRREVLGYDTIDALDGVNINMFGEMMYFKLSFLINAYPNIVKVFDNVRFGASSGMADRFTCSYDVKNGQTTILTTDTVNPSRDISNRYYDYRYAIPRTTRKTTNQYGNRLRGKIAKFTVENNVQFGDMELQYVTTKFRTLWS